MRRLIVVFAVFVLVGCAAVASAQVPVTTANKIGWDQVAPTLAEAQGYTYKYYPDASTTGVALTSVVCSSITSPTGAIIQCEAPFPAFTPGSHVMALTASNTAGESAKSVPISFAFVIIPSAPINLRIK